MNSFNSNIENLDIPMLHITSNGLYFNSHCLKLLGDAKYLGLAIDRKNKKLAIKVSHEQKGFICNIVETDNNKYNAHIYSDKIHSELIQIIGSIPDDKTMRFLAEYDIEKNILIVDLTKGIE